MRKRCSVADVHLLHYGSPLLEEGPGVSKHTLPKTRERKISVPWSGTAENILLEQNSSTSVTSVELNETAFFTESVKVNVRLTKYCRSTQRHCSHHIVLDVEEAVLQDATSFMEAKE